MYVCYVYMYTCITRTALTETTADVDMDYAAAPTTPQAHKRNATTPLETTTPQKQRATQPSSSSTAPTPAPANHHAGQAPTGHASADIGTAKHPTSTPHPPEMEEPSNRHIFAMLQQVLNNQLHGQEQTQNLATTLQQHDVRLNSFDDGLRQLKNKMDGATWPLQEQMRLIDKRMQELETTTAQEKN